VCLCAVAILRIVVDTWYQVECVRLPRSGSFTYMQLNDDMGHALLATLPQLTKLRDLRQATAFPLVGAFLTLLVALSYFLPAIAASVG
jgi:hypothetical protein